MNGIIFRRKIPVNADGLLLGRYSVGITHGWNSEIQVYMPVLRTTRADGWEEAPPQRGIALEPCAELMGFHLREERQFKLHVGKNLWEFPGSSESSIGRGIYTRTLDGRDGGF